MEKTVNFCILAHIDHGKSTLADRFLELTKAVPKDKMRNQYLDSMDLEQERGITIKMHPVRMIYHPQIQNSGFKFILNLIDTPGHVDFSYEVSRALASCEGALLLVDAAKGIQAQTIANLEQAKKHNLTIIAAVNKIDLPQARTEKTKTELAALLNVSQDDIFEISAKYGTNVDKLLDVLVQKIPAPRQNHEKPFRALIFDSKYDYYKGTLACVRVFDGEVSSGDKIFLMSAKTEGMVKELGYFSPEPLAQKKLKGGEIGYIATGIKQPGKVRVGDTIIKIQNSNVHSLPGYQEPKPMVFASLYPERSDDFEILKDGLGKLKLNDAALTFEQETKEALGRGFRCGFLGILHAEIVAERLRRELNLPLMITNPQVIYQVVNKKDEKRFVYSPSDWPPAETIKQSMEPWVKMEIITPNNYLGRVLELLKSSRASHQETKYFGQEKTLLIYEAPLRTIISGFYDKLKGVSQGFASMNYEFLDYRVSDLVKLEILVAGRKEDALSKIVSRQDAFSEGKRAVQILKETLPRQLFSIPLQATLGGKIIARETIRAKGKDVIAPLYGGDYTRKRKLLERQKKGKKKLKEKGRLRIPQKTFLELFRRQ